MLKCLNCNNIIPDDSEFCQYCGNKVIVTEKSKKAEIFKNTLSIKKNHNVSSFFNIITLLSIIISIALLTENTQLKKELQTTKTSLENLRESHSELIKTNQSLEYDLDKLNENYDDYEMAYYFTVKHVKLYVNGEYHSFGCDKIRKYGATSYNIYNDASSVGSSSCFCSVFANLDRDNLDSKYQYIIP